HLFIDQFPHRLRLSDMRVGIDYTLHIRLLLVRMIFLSAVYNAAFALCNQGLPPLKRERCSRSSILPPQSSVLPRQSGHFTDLEVSGS
ncbi:MAG TPA: hypothetical protein VMS25_07445, partial [Candidatus Limnocylindrales bacterium]|nr:hypothetical protein [Candidatus Limnocylindrales bacterium]